VEALLADLASRGVELQARGGRLRFRPQNRVTPRLLEQLKLHKAELLESLARTDDPPLWPVTDANMLGAALFAVDESERIGLDCETTGLDPRRGRVRLLSLATERGTYLVDCFAVDPRALWDVLADKTVIAHNAAFDLAFLAGVGFVPGIVHDTMILSQLVYAGQYVSHKLTDCCERELGRGLDKTEQRSDWSGNLSPAQMAYAAADADVLLPLYRALDAKIEAAGLERASAIEHRCLPALVWLTRTGVPFDVDAWRRLAADADAEAHRLAAELDAVAPPAEQPGMFGSWAWDSPTRVKAALAAGGVAIEATDDDTLAGIGHPLARLIRQYREAKKRSTTYGRDWLKHVDDDGRVRSDWRQLGAKTGRMASGSPNLQNVPHAREYRRCFRAPTGRVLVKADFSQIELRLAAKIANEERMIDAFRRGEDLHMLTARQILGKDDVSKDQRKIAKPVNFGLIYGLSAKSLRTKVKSEAGVDLTPVQAKQYRAAFFRAWPGIDAWHARLRRQRTTETRTLAGRRCLIDADTWYGARANYAVQGSGGDGIKLALALLWERRGEVPGAFPVAVIHDELLIEADADRAEAAATWVRQAMLDAMRPMLDPVPVEVEVHTAPAWAG
jgi:DNA polymerase-1